MRILSYRKTYINRVENKEENICIYEYVSMFRKETISETDNMT